MQTKLNFRQSLMAALLAAVTAAIVNSILFFLFRATGAITDNIFVQPGQPLSVIPVIISSILPSLIAGIVFFLFEKYSSKGFRNFTILSIVLMLLSFANPFMIKDVTTGYVLALNFMHIIVVASLLFYINRSIKNNSNTQILR